MANRVEIIHEEVPPLQLQYVYKHSFLDVATAFMKKYNWEERTTLTTVTGVQQPSNDKLVFYRRVDFALTPSQAWEKVTINRDQHTITSELISPITNGYRIMERSVFKSQDDNTVQDYYVYDDQGLRTYTVEKFRNGVERILKAMKFAQFEAS